MRARYWLAVLLTGLVFSGYLWWFDQGASHEPREEITTTPLFASGLGELQRIALEVGLTQVRITREGETWRIDDRLASTAQQSFIKARLGMFGAAQVERSFALASVDVAALGVTSSALRVNLYWGDSAQAPRSFAFGNTTPDGFACYVLVQPDNVVITLPAYQADNLQQLASGL